MANQKQNSMAKGTVREQVRNNILPLKHDENDYHKRPNSKINVFLKEDHLCEMPLLCPHDPALPLWLSSKSLLQVTMKTICETSCFIHYSCSGRVAFPCGESSVLYSTSTQGRVITCRFTFCLSIPLFTFPVSVSPLRLRFCLLYLTHRDQEMMQSWWFLLCGLH